MTDRHDGGQAFPELGIYEMPDGERLSLNRTGGMTLRDWFAGQALAGLTTLDADCGPLGVARDAYAHADAMLMARSEKKP